MPSAATPSRSDAELALRREAEVFARYLLGVAPEPEIVRRYVDACARLFEQAEAKDRALVAYAVRHPGALPYLDGAAGLLRPGALLRKKLLTTAALLEATPQHAEAFLPVRTSALGLALRLVGLGLVGGFHAAVGACLLPLAERTRS